MPKATRILGQSVVTTVAVKARPVAVQLAA
jgi:hypothetical protein